MSAFLLRFKANSLEKMPGFPYFSLSIPIALAKIYFFPRSPNLLQKPLYLVGTVLKPQTKQSPAKSEILQNELNNKQGGQKTKLTTFCPKHSTTDLSFYITVVGKRRFLPLRAEMLN